MFCFNGYISNMKKLKETDDRNTKRRGKEKKKEARDSEK